MGDVEATEAAELDGWAEELDGAAARLGPRFVRSEARRHARAYLEGLLGDAGRKNGWQLAEALGDATPYGVQQFLYRADWDADAVRDDLRAYVMERLADQDAVLVLDETSFPKKGTKSVGVARQYCGALGQLANCQVGVFLLYASPKGAAFLDRALFLPQAWTNDPERRRAAGVPDDIESATKPQLARALLERALGAGVPAAWVTADEGYGDDHRLRVRLEQRPMRYVLAVTRKDTVSTTAWLPERVGDLVATLPADGWARRSCGAGAKGPRRYDWQRLRLLDPPVDGWARWLLVRRNPDDPTDLQPYVCFAPTATTLDALLRIAGRRWTIEAAFEAAKQEVGLGDYEVRSWQGWHRHITLALVAHALLVARRAAGDEPAAAKGGRQKQPTGALAAFRQRRASQQPSSRSPSPRSAASSPA